MSRRRVVAPREKEPHVARTPEPERGQTVPEEQAPQKPVTLAQVGEIKGEVKVVRQGREEWLGPGVLFSILPGDTLATSSPGQVRLDLQDGDYICLNDDAEVTVGKEAGEILFNLGKGEVYVEKGSAEGSVAVDTGFGRIRSRRGRFHLKKLDRSEFLLHVLDGEVECHERTKDYSGKYGKHTRAWFRRGEHLDKGTKFDSEDDFGWAAKMRPRRRGYEGGKRHGPGKRGRPPFPGGPGSMGRFFRMLVEEFDKLDADGDGKLTMEELKFPSRDGWNRFMEEFDTDGDGGLSPAECEAIQEKMKEYKGPGRRGRGGPRGEDGGPGDR
jgi:hypothetical protein